MQIIFVANPITRKICTIIRIQENKKSKREKVIEIQKKI